MLQKSFAMGKGFNILALGLLALVGWSFINKANAGKKILVNFRTLKLLSTSGFSLPTIQAIFTLQNPTSQQIQINSLVGSLFVNGKHLSNISSFQKITVPGNNEIDLPINIKTGIVDAVRNVVSLLKNKKQKLSVTFEGNVNAENFLIPIKETINLA